MVCRRHGIPRQHSCVGYLTQPNLVLSQRHNELDGQFHLRRNTYSGGTVINAGTIPLANDTANQYASAPATSP